MNIMIRKIIMKMKLKMKLLPTKQS